MKKTLTRLSVILCLFFFNVPYSFSQDNRGKERPRRETSTEEGDNNSDAEAPEEENGNEPERNKRHTHVGVGLGLESGVGLSVLQMGGDNTGINISGTIGAYADLRMAGRFYVQPGLFYTLNGGGDVAFDRVTYYTHRVIINMVEVPLMFAYKTGHPGANARFTIGLGGYFGYNVGAAVNSIDLRIGDDQMDDIRPIEIGVGINAGVELRNGLFFRIKSQRGLTDLQPYSAGPSIYTETHVATIGYLIGKKDRHYRSKRGRGEEYMDRRM